MSTEPQSALPEHQIGFDAHGIEPVPAAHRTSTATDQFWIWAGANIAPINWVLGALGIQLGLSLLQTLAVVVVGNLLGATLFGIFCLMGHRTGVPQMVLGRLAFGRRGAGLPALAQVLMPMGWVATNTWIAEHYVERSSIYRRGLKPIG